MRERETHNKGIKEEREGEWKCEGKGERRGKEE